MLELMLYYRQINYGTINNLFPDLSFYKSNYYEVIMLFNCFHVNSYLITLVINNLDFLNIKDVITYD